MFDQSSYLVKSIAEQKDVVSFMTDSTKPTGLNRSLAGNRVTVAAPSAELSATISIIR